MEYPYVENGWVWFNEDTIVEQFAETRWGTSNKRYYLSIGYEFTGFGNEFTADVRNLIKASNVKVKTICPKCYIKRDSIFNNIMKSGHSKCYTCTRFNDLLNHVFERLLVIKMTGQNKQGAMMWLCRCDCGDITEVRGTSLTNGSTKSCGCLQKEAVTNHNLTEKERNSIRNAEVNVWGKQVKLEDSYICQTCGYQGVKHDGLLVSHHLNGYKDFPEERSDLENGVTLCVDCHKQFHSWMGNYRVLCTSGDFIDFCEIFYPDALFMS